MSGIRWKSFGEWKAFAVAHLLGLQKKYENDQKALNDIHSLLVKLHYLRGRDLSNFLFYCHLVVRDTKIGEILEIIPTVDEIGNLISGEY